MCIYLSNILFLFSSRQGLFNRFLSEPGFFNLTSTFRSDSDFPIPYVMASRRKKPCLSCLPNSTLIKQNDWFMIWFVTHSKAYSKREEYFSKLSKYIPTEIIGRCGKRTSCGHFVQSCTGEITQKSKFHFSAENSICKDYITGKVADIYLINFTLNFIEYQSNKSSSLTFYFKQILKPTAPSPPLSKLF